MAYFQGTFEKRCLTTGAPTHLSFLTASFSMISVLLNIPGNILVILAVAIDPHKNLRSPFNYFMANLAVADLIVGTLTGPLSIYIHIKEGLDEKILLTEIHLLHMSYFISCTASVLSLAPLAVERYLAICDPHTYRNKLTGKRLFFTIGCIWLISLTLPFVYFEVGFITCAFILDNTSAMISIGITCFTYTLMVYKFKQRTKEQEEDTTTANDQDMKTSTHQRSALHDNAIKWERKITKMFLVAMVGLICCYGPAFIFIYITSFCESCSCPTLHWFRDLHIILTTMNSNVNFFCYGLRSPRFREAFAHILRIRRSHRITTTITNGESPL